MNATENIETGAERQGPRLCTAGYRTPSGECWREATEKIIPERPYLEVCAEHYRALQLSSEEAEMVAALENVQEWIAAKVDGPVETILQPHAWEMRAAMEEKFWGLYVAARTADRIAGLASDEAERITPEAPGEFTEFLERIHAVEAAITNLEDAPQEMFGAVAGGR